jgi:hypothetical protein
MRRDGVNVDTSGPHPEDAVVPPAHDRWQDAEHGAGYPGGGDRDYTPPGQVEMEADEPELG